MQITQCPAKRFDFLFVCGLLALGYLQQFEQLIHFIKSFPERFDDLVYIIDSLLNRLSRSRLARFFRGMRFNSFLFPDAFASLVLFAFALALKNIAPFIELFLRIRIGFVGLFRLGATFLGGPG